jgi:hypothetical protein
MIILTCRGMNQSPMEPINHKNTTETMDDIRFFSEVHLLAGKLVPVVVTHSLGGSRANWHHMSNPQPGAAQPTQDEGSHKLRAIH